MYENEGGPAFPSSVGDGMSLRDYFAAQAMALVNGDGLSVEIVAGMLGKPAKDYDVMVDWPRVVAILAYTRADAMLAARSK